MAGGISLLDLLLFPVTGPIRLVHLALEQLAELADKELYDEAALRTRLLELHMSYELGELAEAEYEATEAVLLQRLAEAMARRQPERDTPEDEGDGGP